MIAKHKKFQQRRPCVSIHSRNFGFSPYVRTFQRRERSLVTAHQRRTFLVLEADTTTGTDEQAISALEYPDEGEQGEGKSRPVDEGRRTLLGEDGEEGETNGDGSREITLGSGESIRSGGSFEEEQGKEYQNFGPDSGALCERIDTEGLEYSEDDENRGPSVVKGKGKLDKNFVC